MLALRRSVNATARAVKNTAVVPTRRWFGEALTIPTDREQQAGRRKEELDAEAGGGVGFNRDPIVPASDAGTKENPILVRRNCARVFCLLLCCVSHSSTLSLSLSPSRTISLSLSLSRALSITFGTVFAGTVGGALPCCWLRRPSNSPARMV